MLDAIFEESNVTVSARRLNCSDTAVWSARIVIGKYNLKFSEMYDIIYIESERGELLWHTLIG